MNHGNYRGYNRRRRENRNGYNRRPSGGHVERRNHDRYRAPNEGGRHFQNNQPHPEHPIRDAIYAVLTCFCGLGFAAMWWGLCTYSVKLAVIGIAACALALVSVIVSYVRTLRRFRNR